MAEFTAQIYGARGTLPVPDPAMARYGGNTSCVALRLEGRLVVLDAGSGLVELGRVAQADGTREIDLIISHAHYDHVLGLPFFAPLLDPAVEVRLWFAGTVGAATGEALVEQLIRAPFLPFSPSDLRARLTCLALPRSGLVNIAGAELRCCPVNHPGGNTGLRITHAERSLVYVADFEQDDGPQDAALAAFAEGADLALLDCTYTPEDYEAHRGYGHAHWRACAAIADTAGIARWGLFHHNHTRSDAMLDKIAIEVAARAPHAFVCREGDRFDLIAPPLGQGPT